MTDGRARLVVHLIPDAPLPSPAAPQPAPPDAPPAMRSFYRRLLAQFSARGGMAQVLVHDRDLLPDQVAADADFHIVDYGRFAHPRVLNSGMSYLIPYWNLDPHGVRGASSMADRAFRPGTIDGPEAARFHKRLHLRATGKRLSRNRQPEGRRLLPTGSVAVFLQGPEHCATDRSCHLDRDAMLAALMAANRARPDPRPVVVKPHPRDTSRETAGLLAKLAAADPRILVSDANVHDILAAAAVTVTINSGAGIESLIHSVPLVLCGRADFQRCAVTVTAPDQMAAAMATAEATVWPYRKFLYWYFALNCIHAGSPRMLDDVLARIAATGFDVSRFGLAAAAPGPGAA